MSRGTKKLKCGLEDKGKRLDIFLVDNLSCSRSEAQKMMKNKFILLNGQSLKKARPILKETDVVEILSQAQAEPQEVKIIPVRGEKGKDFSKEIRVINEEKDYLIIDKPSGLLVHPTLAYETNTLKDWLLKKYPLIKKVGDDPQRPGIVHRLDKDASGVMVIAKTQKMFDYLKDQFKNRTVEKEYSVLVHGAVNAEYGTIDFDIDRGVEGSMVARPKIDILKLKNVNKQQGGKEAMTEFWIDKAFTRFTLLKVQIHTGRTHQIRVHMQAFNHPVVGDNLYFNKKLNRKRDEVLGRLFLHSRRICFQDLAGEKVCFESKLPEKLHDFLLELK